MLWVPKRLYYLVLALAQRPLARTEPCARLCARGHVIFVWQPLFADLLAGQSRACMHCPSRMQWVRCWQIPHANEHLRWGGYCTHKVEHRNRARYDRYPLDEDAHDEANVMCLQYFPVTLSRCTIGLTWHQSAHALVTCNTMSTITLTAERS